MHFAVIVKEFRVEVVNHTGNSWQENIQDIGYTQSEVVTHPKGNKRIQQRK